VWNGHGGSVARNDDGVGFTCVSESDALPKVIAASVRYDILFCFMDTFAPMIHLLLFTNFKDSESVREVNFISEAAREQRVFDFYSHVRACVRTSVALDVLWFDPCPSRKLASENLVY
jgi:hypothetical protein